MRLREAASVRVYSGSPAKEAVEDQQDDGSESGDNDAPQIERLNPAETDKATQEAAENRSDDPDEDSYDETAGVLTGNQKFSKSAGNQAEKDPGDNSHMVG
jgi:hypothetical protein